MIGEPTIDPSLGDRRRKALLAALQQAAGVMGGSQQLPSYGATGQNAVSGFGIRPTSRGGRPPAILNFLTQRGPGGYARGLASFRPAGGGLGRLISDPQAPTPIPPQSGTGGAVGTTGGSIPTTGTGGVSTPQGVADAINAEDPNKATPASVTPSGSVFEGSLPGWSTGGTNTGSGWIPLGGGLFLDPDTGVMHGAGMTSGGLKQ